MVGKQLADYIMKSARHHWPDMFSVVSCWRDGNYVMTKLYAPYIPEPVKQAHRDYINNIHHKEGLAQDLQARIYSHLMYVAQTSAYLGLTPEHDTTTGCEIIEVRLQHGRT